MPVDPALFDERTLAALAYADEMTTGGWPGDFVTDATFARLRSHFTTEEIVVLTELIAWENASARFNRALGVEPQHLWDR